MILYSIEENEIAKLFVNSEAIIVIREKGSYFCIRESDELKFEMLDRTLKKAVEAGELIVIEDTQKEESIQEWLDEDLL